MLKNPILLLILFFSACSSNPVRKTTVDFDPLKWVDPFIGTANNGNTYPGAVVPWGMASVSPHNLNMPELIKSSTSYIHGEPHIYGFGQVHLSGVGCNNSGSIILRPVPGKLIFDYTMTRSGYSEEEARPGYYAVRLDDLDIRAEMTATTRTGLSRFEFNTEKAHLLVDLGFTEDWKKSGTINIIDEDEFSGIKDEGDFCGCGKTRQVYFYGKLSRKSVDRGLFREEKRVDTVGRSISGDFVGAWFSFDEMTGEDLQVQIGISYVSIENAKMNLEAEQSGFEFDKTLARAEALWRKELGRIEVKGGEDEDFTKLYTAFYHSLLMPVVFNDVNGEYRTMEKREIARTSATRYAGYSLWDTYRTLHPLLTITHPSVQMEMVESMVGMYKENGWLPKWEIMGHDALTMVGDPASIVIGDTYLKGLRDFDTETAWEAMKKSGSHVESQNMLRRGFRQYMKYGYIPFDARGNDTSFAWENDYTWGTVSTSLELNLADFNIAKMADAMGKKDDQERFMKQAMFYKNLFDKEAGFFRPRNKDGSWVEPFDPLQDHNNIFNRYMRGGPGFVEGTAWNYLFFVPFDIPGLIDLMGGEEIFVSRLQECFDQEYFDMTNEPDIAYPFLFNYVDGEEWRTQKEAYNCSKKYFGTGPDGLPGNDDAGTLSAWLVFAMMGIYPDCPGIPEYQISIPQFNEINLHLDPQVYPGKTLKIMRKGGNAGNAVISKILYNGEGHDGYNISHEKLVRGGILEIITE